MIFITGPLYSGKRTFAQRLPGTRIAEVQALAAEAEDLEKLAEELSAYDIVMATEVGGGVVPMDAGERAAREAAGRLACLLAARAGCQHADLFPAPRPDRIQRREALSGPAGYPPEPCGPRPAAAG